MPEPLRKSQMPGRNDPCPCESGLKFKHCHGDEAKIAHVRAAAERVMQAQIVIELKKRGMLPSLFHCEKCNKPFDVPQQSTVAPQISLCPFCGGPAVKNETKPVENKIVEGNYVTN